MALEVAKQTARSENEGVSGSIARTFEPELVRVGCFVLW